MTPFAYPHMCRMDHVEIGHADNTSERCPLCRALDSQRVLLAALKAARQALYDIAAGPTVWSRDEMIERALQAEFAARADIANVEAK
jgi:hypothetical protein